MWQKQVWHKDEVNSTCVNGSCEGASEGDGMREVL